MGRSNKFLIYLLVLILFLLPAVWSLFHPGFFPSHDGEWMVIRLSDFHRSLISGQFPVRWADRLNYTYGYPIFNFLYPLSFYFGEIFHLLGVNFVTSIKLVFISSFFLSGLFMYLWGRQIWGNLAGLVAALVYVYTPYRFLDVYVRGSLGEAVAFIFPPLIFWMADKLGKKWDRTSLFIGGLAFAGLITSHNTMAMLFTFIFLGYLAFSLVFRPIWIFILGLGLSSFFWLPALFDTQYVIFRKVVISNFFLHFPTLRQLLIPNWGYGPSLPMSAQDTLSFQIGLPNLVIFLFFSILIARGYNQAQEKRTYLKENFKGIYFLLVFILSLFLMLDISSSLWRLFLVSNFIQFPWRLLALTTFSSTVLVGGLINLLPKRLKFLIAVFLIIWIIIASLNYAKPEYFVDRGEGFYTTNEATTTVADEYLPVWLKKPPTSRPPKKVEIITGEGKIENLQTQSKRVSFKTQGQTPLTVRVNTVYFPGWQAFLNEKKIPINYQDEGLMKFNLPQGTTKVRVKFGETPIRLLADFISLISLGFIAFLVIKRK